MKSTDRILTKRGRLPASHIATLQRFNNQNCSSHKKQTKDNIVHINIFLEIALLLKI